MEGFSDLIQAWWNELQFEGCGAFILAKKISKVRKRLKHRAKFEFGSIKLKKLEALHDLEFLDISRESHRLSSKELKKEADLSLSWDPC